MISYLFSNPKNKITWHGDCLILSMQSHEWIAIVDFHLKRAGTWHVMLHQRIDFKWFNLNRSFEKL